jgi:hypothetical protein
VTIESATYINTLNNTLPASGDPKSEGDDHLRLIKAVLLSTFPGITGAVAATHSELNTLSGITSTVAELNALHLSAVTQADLAKLHGTTATAAELNTHTASGVTQADHVKLHAITAAAADLVAPSSSTVTLGTNWAATGASVGFAYLRKGVDGIISVDFDIFATAINASTSTIMTFPAGYRPVADILINCMGSQSGGGTLGTVVVKIAAATGVMSYFAGSVIPGPSANDRIFLCAQFPSR